ncbi:hypothetical protein AWJ20_4813 [Sugiyamaella lignohabitans]|uniref:Nudix hydrolase domain-containing protein n=1 Tax=Sugiyamaella lignohabitans TaxID=796027 RepID=A0A167EB89_9ASCO|nr:uncharacterized protein AWJ20_4813 [Sugiyamaella lignohabitans]ANB13862.1 hypothetical protein AWJ20_4813 [Sugiyamaella lignohabitans]
MSYSNLDLINQVDSVPYTPQPVDAYYEFRSHDSKAVLGYILPEVAKKLNYPDTFTVTGPTANQRGAVTINSSLDSAEKRSEAIAKVLEDLKENKTFQVLQGWRNELYTVYNPTHVPYFLIERAGSGLFGIVTYGVHLVGYQPATETSPLKIWVPRRSYTKATYPGMLDNTIAGGIGYPCGVHETAIKEAYEEAGLDEEFMEKNLRPAGVVTYFHQVNNHFFDSEASSRSTTTKDEATYQPEVEFIYDVIMAGDVKPRPVDGEVAEFYLMDVETVKQELAKGSFKYNCALVMIDFFIRHGILTYENEPDFVNIAQRCHRVLEFPMK